ncbi:MAG TPA: ATP-binding cassette domain-containing protein [Patescibacteria group bacterium]|nr:ATP-binding cassette domain-containing protein [Patescibacteria group bacterium]
MSKEAIIEVRGLTVEFDGRTIFKNVSFDIYKGEIFVILGGSGCGKSTMLRTLIGLVEPVAGSIIIGGEDFIAASSEERLRILRKFGILFQSSGLFASMTLAENVALPLQTYTSLPEDHVMDVVSLKLNAVGLKGYEDFLPSEISGGMKKRAGLARAMALDPQILCFDEPSAGLDPITSASLDELIINLNQALGSTMVVVTHELDSIYKIAHRVIMLDKTEKNIIAEGDPKILKDSQDERIYNFFNRVPAE